MLKRSFLSLFVSLLVFAFLTDGASSKGVVCKLKEMEDALVKKKPKMEPIIHKFTPRSILEAMKNCTNFIGDLKVNSFGAENRNNNEYVRTKDLENVKHLSTIEGNVLLELSQYSDIKNLSFFNGLKIKSHGYNLMTFSLRNSKVAYLFPPKYKIDVFYIEIINNTQLCYIQNFTLGSLYNYTISGNKDFKDCQKDGKVCDRECTSCKGPGTDTYLCYCKNVQYKDMCVSSCPNGTLDDTGPFDVCQDCSSPYITALIYYYKAKSGLTRCGVCDRHCAVGCSGPTSKECSNCNIYKYFYDDNNSKKFQCLSTCPKKRGAKVIYVPMGKLACNNAAGSLNFSLLAMFILTLISKLASNLM